MNPQQPLAKNGGQPVRSTPFPPWPHFDEDERGAVDAVLASGRVNYWTGETVREFEQEFTQYLGVPYGVALANGTVALELALRALGVGPSDEVVVPPRTFIATASAVVQCGAAPVFADVDPDSGTITAETVRAVLTPRTRAVIPVHLAGWPCPMEPLMDLAAEHDLYVIEDCAQSHGALYRGRLTGTIGHAGVFSFCQDKIMTTGGEGGFLVTRDEDVWRRSWAFKDHGKDYDAVFKREHPPGFRWLHESFGTNWRMSAIQAAIGRRQLAKLDHWLARRRENARMLVERLAKHPALRVPVPPRGDSHAYYKFYAYLRTEALRSGWDNRRIAEAVSAEGVPCFTGSCGEVYLERAFEGSGFSPSHRLPNARALGRESLMLLVHPTAGPADMADSAAAVLKVLAEATQ